MPDLPWLSAMRPASFRGVPMQVLDRTVDGGRRGPDHEFAQRDVPEAEDTGRKQRGFAVQAVVVPDESGDYMPGRDRLLEALEAYGSGLYVDPWQGEWRVVCRAFSVREGVKYGGVAYVDISFVEAGENQFPRATVDTKAAVDEAALAVEEASVAGFEESFDLAGLPSHVTEALTGVGDRVLMAVEQALALPGLTSDIMQLADTVRDLDALRRDLPGLLRGEVFGTRLAGLIGRARGAFGPSDGGRVMAALGTAAGGGEAPGVTALDSLPPVPLTTPTRVRQASNQAALLALPQRLAVAQEARALARRPFVSQDEAHVARAAVLERLDAARLTAAGGAGAGSPAASAPAAAFDDRAFVALGDLRKAVVQDIAARAGALPRLRRETLPEVVPAAVAAYRLTGDASRAADLVARNGVWHPSFMPADRPLEVLP